MVHLADALDFDNVGHIGCRHLDAGLRRPAWCVAVGHSDVAVPCQAPDESVPAVQANEEIEMPTVAVADAAGNRGPQFAAKIKTLECRNALFMCSRKAPRQGLIALPLPGADDKRPGFLNVAAPGNALPLPFPGPDGS